MPTAGVGYVLDTNVSVVEDVAVTGTNISGGILLRGRLFRDSTVSVTTKYVNVAGIQAYAGTVRDVTTVVGGTGTGGVGLDAYSEGLDSAVSAYNVIAIGTGGDVGARNNSSSPQTGSPKLTVDHPTSPSHRSTPGWAHPWSRPAP